MSNTDGMDQIEGEIAEALKPLEAAREATRRPFVSMVDTHQTPAVNAVLPPSQAPDEPIQTVTQRLYQLREENGRLQGRIDALQEDMRDMESRLASLILRVLAVLE